MEEKNKKILTNVIKTGAEITGAIAAGVAVGLIGGPAGVIAGGAAGVLVSKGLLEFVDRQISIREKIRVGAAATYAFIQINHRLVNGETLRDDDFFSAEDKKNQASELLEGVLIKSKNQYQEKKIRFISNIYTNTAFRQDITPENANQILNIAETLTYRKMCILSFLNKIVDIHNLNLREEDFRTQEDYQNSSEQIPLELRFILQDYMDLFTLGLIERNDDTFLIDISDIALNKMQLSEIGREYHDLLGLQELEEEEYLNIIEILKKAST